MAGPTDRVLGLLAELGEQLAIEAAPSADDPAPAEGQLEAFLEAVNACRLARGQRPVDLAQLARGAMAYLGFSRAERRTVLDQVRGVDAGNEQADLIRHRPSRRVGSG